MTGPVISSPGALPAVPLASPGASEAGRVDSGTVGAHAVATGGTPPGVALRQEVLAPPERAPARPAVAGGAHVATPSRSAAQLALNARLGEGLHAKAKDDLKIGPFVYRRSTGLHEIQGKLDAYRAAVAKCNAPPRAGEAGGDALEVSKALEDLESALERYEHGSRHSHKAEMRELLAEVRGEKAVALRHVLPGLTPDQARGLPQRGWTADGMRQWMADGLSRADLQYAARQGFTAHQVEPFRAAKLPINDATRPAFQAQAAKEPLGKGQVNVVYRVTVRGGDGRDMTAVFKPENPSTGGVASAARACGIDQARPQWACRNLATHRVDQQLGFGLVPTTGLALIDGQLGTVMEMASGQAPQAEGNIRIGLTPAQRDQLQDDPALLRDFLSRQGFEGGGRIEGDTLVVVNELRLMKRPLGPDGTPMEEAPLEEVVQPRMARLAQDFEDPALRRDLNRLQWLDVLTGQVDRHAGNYFVSRDASGASRVQAIDNDLAFGARLTSARAVADGDHAGQLPEVADLATYEALKGLSREQLPGLLGGLLDEAEIDATGARLDDIHRQLDRLAGEGAIIGMLDGGDAPADAAPADAAPAPMVRAGALDADRWASPAISRRLGIPEQSMAEQLALKQAQLKREGASDNAIGVASRQLQDRFLKDAKAAGYLARDWAQQEANRSKPGETPVLDLSRLPRASA